MTLKVNNTNWQLKENTSKHHTDKYPGTELVLRRGLAFSITLTLSEDWPTGESLTFTVEAGSNASLQAKTRVVFSTSSTANTGTWNADLKSTDSSSVSISISSPANAAIGQYKLSVKAGSGDRAPTTNLGTFVLLFNPWLSEDDVFMPDNTEREEYVLSEFGVIFVGNINRIGNFGWNYGQFQGGILNICLSLLDRSLNYRKDPATDMSRRNDPKYVGRVLSAMVNSNDDNGVVMGNWSGNYSGGESPSTWTGSVDILQKWKSSGFKPVRFGQCWVFAGVLATVLRCLGMPARVISNFNSAHDTDQNLSVDVYYDPSGNPINIGGDSVWNFHVWNEGWFTRTDLGSTYDGWQILDSTPQERSTGIFQCGPASLKAIKEGDVDLDYDGPFVFAEVNADRITWTYDSTNGEKKQVYAETKSIGQFTSTKALGSYTRLDVTNNYKYEEGSRKEREVYEKARGKVRRENAFSATSQNQPRVLPKPDISGKFKVDGSLEVGKDVNMTLVLKNLTNTAKIVKANMTAWTMVYNGKPIREVWKDSLSVTFGSEEEKTVPIKITYAMYQKHLVAYNMIRVTALCQIQDGAEVVVERDIALDNPDISMQVLGEAKVNQTVNVEVVFKNPINMEVKNCVLLAEGSDLLKGKLKIDVPSLKPKQSSKVEFEVIPTKSGTKQLLINFSCDKFQAIKAFETIDVAS
uniref:protein-glutamine gamma-glutamyltransferase n=1 Tax=Sphenodon punctatus TaxID=8508 RepID=A0A8D0L2I7_SPHPU